MMTKYVTTDIKIMNNIKKPEIDLKSNFVDKKQQNGSVEMFSVAHFLSITLLFKFDQHLKKLQKFPKPYKND
jgi:hypothetical protein